MELHEKAFWGERAQTSKKEITRRLKRKKEEFPIIVLLPARSQTSNVLELIPAAELCKERRDSADDLIIGVASGKTEAIEVARCIIDAVYQETGGFNIRAYFPRTSRTKKLY